MRRCFVHSASPTFCGNQTDQHYGNMFLKTGTTKDALAVYDMLCSNRNVQISPGEQTRVHLMRCRIANLRAGLLHTRVYGSGMIRLTSPPNYMM